MDKGVEIKRVKHAVCRAHPFLPREEQRLAFASSPCLENHTWTKGTVDITVNFYGFPYAYMCVEDGVFDAETIYHDARWELDCRGGGNCLPGALLMNLVDEELFSLLREDILKGCTALVEKEWPQALSKRGE